MRKLTEKLGKTANPFAAGVVVAVFFLAFTGFHAVKESVSLSPGDVLITEQSKLALSGTSNVNKFTCECTQKFSPMAVGATSSSNRSQIVFANTALKLTTTKLDCGQKIMNKDMYRTLKAEEYPYITIELKKAQFPVGVTIDDCAEWVELDAETVITIAGNARKVPLKVKARNLASGRFQFRSAQALKMTDFGIQPPTAMMGAIKVRDAITIQFDLIVTVSSAGEISAS